MIVNRVTRVKDNRVRNKLLSLIFVSFYKLLSTRSESNDIQEEMKVSKECENKIAKKKQSKIVIAQTNAI